jgi:integrase
MVKIRPYVVAVNHVPGCPRLESGQGGRKQGRRRCAPGCERVTDGWEVDLALRQPDGTTIRERVKAPVTAKSAALRWALDRETRLIREGTKEAIGRETAKTTKTVTDVVEDWIAAREARGVDAVKDEKTRLRLHVLPTLGRLPIADLRPHHVRDLVTRLRATKSRRGTPLAPRSVRHVYAALHQVLHDAIVDEIIPSNPCVLKRGELPAKIDRDPTWRPTAVFTRDEIETLISDERLPEDRRVLYALEFLTGMRMGEAAALAWRAYDPTLVPLGRLLVATSYNTRSDKVKSTKTERPREVPVHATLVSVLAAWKLSGWRRMMRRPPAADDLIVPARGGGHRNVSYSLKVLHEVADPLRLRRRVLRLGREPHERRLCGRHGRPARSGASEWMKSPAFGSMA